MIRYRLVCASDHEFEVWFRSSADYEDQIERQAILCPNCGIADVSKALMAPNVSPSRNRASTASLEDKSQKLPQQVANLPQETVTKLVNMMRAVREHVTKNAEYVGEQFADEARKIHFEEGEQRGIYGKATREEVKELEEDGVPVAPLPILPEDYN